MENSFSGGRSWERKAGLTASGLEEEVDEAAQLALKGREEEGMKMGGFVGVGVRV
jgi:hypothetical protein